MAGVTSRPALFAVALASLAVGMLSSGPAAAADKTVSCRSLTVREGIVDSDNITITPLSDPHNPFRKEYAAWDKWVYAHAVDVSDPRVEQYHGGVDRRGNTVLEAYVDAAGNLVPLALAEERLLHAYAIGDNAHLYDEAWTHVLFAAGVIDAQLLAGYQQAMLALRAQYSLPLPAWLAANPPAWALVLPPEAGSHAGEVIMLGAPGEDQDFTLPLRTVRPGGRAKVWRRYSPEGKLLATSKPGQEWWELYTANPAVPAGRADTTFYLVFEADGLISVTDQRSGQRAWLMNFDGTRLPDAADPAPRNHNYWLGFTANEARAIYALQHGKLPPGAAVQAPSKPRAHVAPLGGTH